MVAAGWLGRKTGRGWYDYAEGTSTAEDDPEPPAPTTGANVEGLGPVADALRQRATSSSAPTIVVDGLSGTVEGEPFYAIVPLQPRRGHRRAGEAAFSGLGLHTARVSRRRRRAPAHHRQLVNEAHFSLGEGVAGAQDIDDGLVLGLNHPRGPLAWGELLGLDKSLADAGAAARGPRRRLPPGAPRPPS